MEPFLKLFNSFFNLLQCFKDGVHGSKIDNITSSSHIRIRVAVFGTDWSTSFCMRTSVYRISCFPALSYPETGHACGSVKHLDSATISWRKSADIHYRTPSSAVGLRPASLSVLGQNWDYVLCNTVACGGPHIAELSSWRRSPTRKHISFLMLKEGWSSQLGPPNPTPEVEYLVTSKWDLTVYIPFCGD